MATKKLKNRYLSARVDQDMETRINNYLEASEELTVGALVRKSVNEYLLNHPIKSIKPKDATNITKPGGM